MSTENDTFLLGLSNEGGARVLAVDATASANEVVQRHGLMSHAAQSAAEGMVAAQLMSAYIKGEERITLQVQAEAPRFAMIVDVNADGSTRGRFTPAIISRSRPMRGAIMVIKHDVEREMYRGVAPIEDTDFQGALQAFLVHSQQSVGIVRVQASVDAQGVVTQAHGLLVEKLPDQETEVFNELFGALVEAELDKVLPAAVGGELWGFPLEVLETRALRFHCPCSHQRSQDILAGLGAAELAEMIEQQGGAEITCNFCLDAYAFDAEDLRQLIRHIEAPN